MMINTSFNVEKIVNKRLNQQRIDVDETLFLYQHAPLSELLKASYKIKVQLYGEKVFFIQNVHIEPSNYCAYKCRFCSFHKEPDEDNFWEYTHESIINWLQHIPASIKEIHITGGVHPDRDLDWYLELLKKIKKTRPNADIKGFTAIEINFMCKKSGVTIEEGLSLLKKHGLSSLAGGGAEIFNPEIRQKLCPEKGKAELWINIHRQAHVQGIVSNATMLYGHIEKPEHRIEHMNVIRQLQDETHGFNSFIPLKFRRQHNFLSYINELPFIEDLKMIAISRLFFDNIPHIKTYWPMLGKEKSFICLHAGADDIDGTIFNSTKIYSMAGGEEQIPSITAEEIINLIKSEGFIPVERNLFYQEIV
jgi:aminodeoxyfutalosine synthase